MIRIKKVNESFVSVIGDGDEVLNISEYFSFYSENYRWSPKFRAGLWSGKIYLLNRRNGFLPIGLYPKLKNYCKQTNIETEIDFTKTSIIVSDNDIINFSKNKVKLKFDLRDYQINGIKFAFKNQKGIVLSPTGCMDPETKVKVRIYDD